jgi:hypothetical protein
MTRLETALTLGAATLASAGTASASHRMWWETGFFLAVAAFLAEGASRERHHRRARERAVAVRLERLARGHAVIEPPRPCCSFWQSSEGAVHGPRLHEAPSRPYQPEPRGAAGPRRDHRTLRRGHSRMTGPSSTPRGEHTPAPGTTWEQHLVRTETVIDDDAPDPVPNRKTRRAMQRAARRNR